METPPRFSETNGPRFTEHLFSTPPYQQYPDPNLSRSPVSDYRQASYSISPQFSHATPTTPPYAPEYGYGEGTEESLRHRLSNKETVLVTPTKGRSMSPEVQSPGLESVWAGEGEKEVAVQQHEYFQPQRPQEQQPADSEKRRICGIPATWFYILLAAIVVIGVGLGVGLGVRLGKKKSSSPSPSNSTTSSGSNAVASEYLIGGALNSSFYSTSGAFNGSGIALASQSFASTLEGATQGSLVMYFQHHSGQIRWQQLSPTGAWQGGSISETVANDAKNSTPLSAVAYQLNGTSTWHIFYIDTNNFIKQRTNSNTTNVWVDGPLNAAKLVANDADQVGMQACWYGSDYGDSDYAHTPLPGNGTIGNAAFSNEVGMHLWYASNGSTFQQYGWRDGDTKWEFQATWAGYDGYAGVGCYSWGPGTTTYAMLVNQEQTVEFWWKDTNSNATGTEHHPINKWTNASEISITGVQPATSLGYTNYFYAQDGLTNQIRGYNISWASENTTILSGAGDTFTVQGAAGLPGTHLSVSALPNLSGGNDLVVFCQTEGDDITEFTRDFLAGQWTSASLSIPDD